MLGVSPRIAHFNVENLFFDNNSPPKLSIIIPWSKPYKCDKCNKIHS